MRGRKTGGRTKGTPNKATVEKRLLQEHFEARIAARFDALIDSHLLAAEGVSHIMAKDKAGKWVEVTDPTRMAEVMNSGEEFYRISARNPDVRALKELWDRMWGQPKQALDVTATVDVSTVSTADLLKQAAALQLLLASKKHGSQG